MLRARGSVTKRFSKAAWIACMAVAALAASACGDSGSKTSTATTTAATSGGATTTGAPACTVDKAVKIIGLVEKPPEGPNAIPDYDEGFQLALDEIKTAGGLCGKPVEFERFPASPTDGNQAKNAFLQAVDKKATVIVGLASSTAMIAAAPEVAKAQIPTIYFGTTPQVLIGTPNGVGSEWGFIIRPRNTAIALLTTDYAVKDLAKKSIGLLCINAAFGQQGCDAAQKEIEALGAKVVDRETHEATDTDLTSKVIGLKNKGVDAVLTFTFPNSFVVFANQAADDGLNVPLFGTGATLAVAGGGIKSAALPNIWGIEDCVPAGDTAAADFVAKYKAKYNKTLPSYAVAEAYDSIMMTAQAVKTAGSADAKKIADSLRAQTFKGICETYKADAGQGLHHSSTFEQFTAQGLPQVRKKVDIPAS